MNEERIECWRDQRINSLAPQLRVQTSAGSAQARQAFTVALRGAGFKVVARGSGIRATRIDWVAVVAGDLNRTRLDLAVTETPDGCEVVVAVGLHGQSDDSKSCRHAAAGLTGALVALRSEGAQVTHTGWQRPA